MKTSNKLIIVAFIMLLSAIVAYDYLIKVEYDSGRYKDPYNNFATLKFKNFDKVDVRSTSAVNVKFVQGPFNVKVDSSALEFARFKQEGSHLIISAEFKDDYVYNRNPYLVIVSCPKLNAINTDAIFKQGKKQIIDTIYRADWNMRQNLIEGFTEDSLSINQSHGSNLILSANHIGVLKAVVGLNKGSFAGLIILKNNVVQKASADVLNKSSLSVYSKTIGNLKYHLADSAKITLTGSAQEVIKK